MLKAKQKDGSSDCRGIRRNECMHEKYAFFSTDEDCESLVAVTVYYLNRFCFVKVHIACINHMVLQSYYSLLKHFIEIDSDE